jgi:hypothetical protein
MRPQPICPIWMRLLGAFFPKTLEGTMLGIAAVAKAVAEVFLIKERRFILFFFMS